MRLGSLTIELVWKTADAHWSASRHGDYKEVSGRERRPGKGPVEEGLRARCALRLGGREDGR